MTVFKGLMRTVAAVAASALVMLLQQVIAYLQSAAPSDVSPAVWGIVSAVGVLVLNLVLGLVKKPE